MDTQLIKDRMTCVEYAIRNGIGISKSGDRCKSPLRNDATNKSSFVVFDQHWIDYGSGEGGDVIDLHAELKCNGDRGMAIRELADMVGIYSEKAFDYWKQSTQGLCNLIETWHENLRPEDIEYLHSRKISDQTIKELKIGYTGKGTTIKKDGVNLQGFGTNRIVIPTFKNGYVCSWTARAIGGAKPKYLKPPNNEFSQSVPWGLNTLNRESNAVYIAEGTFDALSIYQSGLPVLATMGGHFSGKSLNIVYDACKKFDYAVLTFDNDEAGRNFTEKLCKHFFKKRIQCKIAEIPQNFKDISEYYQSGGKIKDLKMQDSILYLANLYSEKKEFREFAFSAARFYDRADIAEMFNFVRQKETFNNSWLTEVEKSCYKCPPEALIVENIIKTHQLLYVNAVGFYEYMPKGKWDLLPEEVINGYISDALGVFQSGSKIEPIKKLLRPKILTTIEFDKKNVINFINGTLELDTGVFREHRSNDFCSMQMTYPYLPNAKAEKFLTFLSQITASDPKREELLQEIAGYVLFPDCRYEKMFVFCGEGGNGKTIFTKILTALFGTANVTNIPPNRLTESFDRIHLRNSLVNIAGEIKSDVSGAEEILKQLVSMEQIQACYKGKDNIKFFSRAKMIFCCNGQLKSSDTSAGLERRLSIINFPCKFRENPNPDDPMEFKADVMLESKLLNELPGIFNWAYEGYKLLLSVGYFTETDEHVEMINNFKRASSPIVEFFENMKDEGLPKIILKHDLYVCYRDWCLKSGHSRPRSEVSFHMEFQRVSERTYERYEKSIWTDGKPKKERGYKLLKT
uniref:DsDNA helicase n=1 Tax=Siphoviridae sp. ctMgg26 TaxID=2825462 RepID=A0A8S5Q165_9CAUD|nr:MAG TPA: dsDNA helicase [Siphoviridae sp. ctMgg26]